MKPIEITNIFNDPEAIRQIAFKQKYYASKDHPLGGNYPGFRSDAINWFDENLFQQTAGLIYDAIGEDRSKPAHIDMFFQYCREIDQPEEWVHRDDLYFKPNWVGLVYLTPNPPPHSGTIIYRLKEGETANEDAYKDSPNRDDYVLDYEIVNEYNKLAMYSPLQYHDSLDCFGDNIENARLFIVFFMKID